MESIRNGNDHNLMQKIRPRKTPYHSGHYGPQLHSNHGQSEPFRPQHLANGIIKHSIFSNGQINIMTNLEITQPRIEAGAINKAAGAKYRVRRNGEALRPSQEGTFDSESHGPTLCQSTTSQAPIAVTRVSRLPSTITRNSLPARCSNSTSAKDPWSRARKDKRVKIPVSVEDYLGQHGRISASPIIKKSFLVQVSSNGPQLNAHGLHIDSTSGAIYMRAIPEMTRSGTPGIWCGVEVHLSFCRGRQLYNSIGPRP